ncbi:MAG: methyl-accepting chemotaxis protein, partial [Gammaproteobacteria bacterium]
RREVEDASQELKTAADSMAEIAKLAQDCNAAAQRAINTAHVALRAVDERFGDISSIRGTVCEMERRIKSLDERSREINGVVGLINTIAYRGAG